MDWEEVLPVLSAKALTAMTEFLRGMGGVVTQDVLDLGSKGIASYQGQMKTLAADCERWRKEGNCVMLLSGGVARGKRLTQALEELNAPATFMEECHNLILGETLVLPMTLSHGFVWPDAKLVLIADTDIYGAGYRKANPAGVPGKRLPPSRI